MVTKQEKTHELFTRARLKTHDILSQGLDIPAHAYYARSMTNAFAHENTPYSAHGEFETFGMPTSEQEWADYDAYMADEIARWDEANAFDDYACDPFVQEDDPYVDLDPEPPF